MEFINPGHFSWSCMYKCINLYIKYKHPMLNVTRIPNKESLNILNFLLLISYSSLEKNDFKRNVSKNIKRNFNIIFPHSLIIINQKMTLLLS